ncbi:MAG: hypothetical protein WDM70_00515 [Nitrosomonadales bacterium]
MADYFDTKSGDGALAVIALKTLRSSSISIELPDISSSLEAVRAYSVTREKASQ